MTLNNRAMDCEGLDFVDSATGPAQELETQVVDRTSNCSWFAGAAELKMNSCELILHPGNPGGSIELGPAGCGGATLTTKECTWSIPAQKGIATNYTNQSTKPASVSMQANGGFTYSVVSGSIFVCGKGTLGGGFYAGWTVTGSAGGMPIPAAVTDHPSVGIFLSGSELAAEGYPVNLGGVQNPSAKRTINIVNRTVTCNQATVAGKATSASSSFTLSPSYSGCTAVVLGNPLPATVDASGCTETYTIASSKAPYTASLNLNCSSPLKISVSNGGSTVCEYEVASQSGLGTVNLANTGEGTARGVDVGWQLGSVQVTRTSGALATCGLTGGKGTATATGTMQVRGSI